MGEKIKNYQFYHPRTGKVIKSDGTVVNEADGVNDDGSRNVRVTGSYAGYSTDPKPVIENPVEGMLYTYLELDTKRIYVLHNGQWVWFM